MERMAVWYVNPTMKTRVSRPVCHFALAIVVTNALLWGAGGAYQIFADRRVKADEAALGVALKTLRRSIDQFAADFQRSPQTLDDLVLERYLNEVPIDPMTGSDATWIVVFETDAFALDGQLGILDVKSGSTRLDHSGQRRYSDW